MTIIPAIDIIDGKCVRLTKGEFTTRKIYNEDPVATAKQFEDAGFQRLHVVDLDGARYGAPKNTKILEAICRNTGLQVDVSGGIATTGQVRNALNAGATYITIGSVAVRDEAMVRNWLRSFGASKFIIAADVLQEQVMIRGWNEPTGLTVFDLIATYQAAGVTQFICTDIEKDGMLNGASVALYKKIKAQFKTIDLIASGGVSNIADIDALKVTGCSAVIVGKAIYENKIQLNELC